MLKGVAADVLCVFRTTGHQQFSSIALLELSMLMQRCSLTELRALVRLPVVCTVTVATIMAASCAHAI